MSIANELITRGWCQKRIRDDEGRVCLMGAVDAAMCRVGVFELLDSLVARYGFDTFENFNDASGRTFDEVLRVAKLADEWLDAEWSAADA